MIRILVGLLMLTSCSITDIASSVLPIGKKPSIEANVALGKTNIQNKSMASVVGEDNRQVADTITNTSSTKAEVINNNSVPPWLVLLAILGWMLPTPSNMFKGMINWKRKGKDGNRQ